MGTFVTKMGRIRFVSAFQRYHNTHHLRLRRARILQKYLKQDIQMGCGHWIGAVQTANTDNANRDHSPVFAEEQMWNNSVNDSSIETQIICMNTNNTQMHTVVNIGTHSQCNGILMHYFFTSYKACSWNGDHAFSRDILNHVFHAHPNNDFCKMVTVWRICSSRVCIGNPV